MSTTSSVEQKQGSAVTIWAIGAFVNPLLLDPRLVNKAYDSFCIFGWEYLLCLSQEYKQIWRKPLNVCFDCTSWPLGMTLIYQHLRSQASYILVCLGITFARPLLSSCMLMVTFSKQILWLNPVRLSVSLCPYSCTTF